MTYYKGKYMSMKASMDRMNEIRSRQHKMQYPDQPCHHVVCSHCKCQEDPRDVNFIGVDDDYGNDEMVYICNNCRQKTQSIVKVGRPRV